MRVTNRLIIILFASAIKGEYLNQVEKDYLESTTYAPISTSINVYHKLEPVGVSIAYLDQLNKFWPNLNYQNPMLMSTILTATAILKATLSGLNSFKENFKQSSIDQCEILNLEQILNLINQIIVSFDRNVNDRKKRYIRMKRTSNAGNSLSAKLTKNLNQFKKTKNKSFLTKFHKDITENICKPNSRAAKQFIKQINADYSLNLDLNLIDKSNRNYQTNMIGYINNFLQDTYDFTPMQTMCNSGSPTDQQTQNQQTQTEQPTTKKQQVPDPSTFPHQMSLAKALTNRFINIDLGNQYEIKNLYNTTINYLNQNQPVILLTISELQTRGLINTDVADLKTNNQFDNAKIKNYINSMFKKNYKYNPLKRPNDVEHSTAINKKLVEDSEFEGSGHDTMFNPTTVTTNTFFNPDNDNLGNNGQQDSNMEIQSQQMEEEKEGKGEAERERGEGEIEEKKETIQVPLPSGKTFSFKINKVTFGIKTTDYDVKNLFEKVSTLYQDGKIEKSTLNVLNKIFQITIENMKADLNQIFRHQPGLLSEDVDFCTKITLGKQQYLSVVNNKFFKTNALMNKKIIEPLVQCNAKTCLKLEQQRFIVDTFPPNKFCKIIQQSSNALINFCDEFTPNKPPCFHYNYRDPKCSFYPTKRPFQQRISLYNIEYTCPKEKQCYFNDIHGNKIANQALTHQLSNDKLDTNFNIIISRSLDFINSIYNLITVSITIIILTLQMIQILFSLATYAYKYFYVKESRKMRKRDKKRRKNKAYLVRDSNYKKRPRIIELKQMSSSITQDKEIEENLINSPQTTHT